jgi:hypothetical protein
MHSFLVRVVNAPSGKKPRTAVSVTSGKSSCATQNKTKPGPVQTYLDLGQKSLGKAQACKTCGMTYVADVEDDIESHMKFCKSV